MPSVDACSFYRGSEPLLQIEKDYADVKVLEANEVNWKVLGAIDIVFMQRAAGANNAAMLQMAKDNGKPIWLDYDDDLLEVPQDNPSHSYYSKLDTTKSILKSLSLANVVTVSNPAITDSFTKALTKAQLAIPKFITIPNAFNNFRWKLEKVIDKRNPIVYWRGSNTHVRDLVEHSEDIIHVAAANPNWHWLFIGPYPWMFEGKIKNLIHQDSLDLIKYMSVLKEVKPAVNIVPLHDNAFNRSKSNIAWLEATYAGAVTLAPDWPEWQRTGIYNYKPYEFRHKLKHLLTTINREPKYLQSIETINPDLCLDIQNGVRYHKVIKELYEISKS
jgi:hypothetical protein